MNPITVINEAEIPDNLLFDAVILNTYFEIDDLHDSSPIAKTNEFIKKTNRLIEKVAELVRDGGLLFVYGLPKYLPLLAVNLNEMEVNKHKFLFKYWIGIEFSLGEEYQILKNSHIGMLMYLKTKSLETPSKFHLNTKEIRVPYEDCAACGKNLKDWGGKKHMMNPLGSALSDVWSDLNLDIENSNEIPQEIINRIFKLIDNEASHLLVIKQEETQRKQLMSSENEMKTNEEILPKETLNKVVFRDSIEYMRLIKEKYPNGIFDLAFADPPYNLAKDYNKYEDACEDIQYVEWCNEWLQGMCDVIKPGGALFVLNIPKWALYHAAFLSDKMNFQHWIVWDALSTPAGKFLPAHYSLLYFTKPGGKTKSNYQLLKSIEHRKYCLRLSCIQKRKAKGDDAKETMGDIWKDVHRIKHKKDRDQHPCQLPKKLVDRVVQLVTDKGDIVYDPFGGAGTTAISAKSLKRNYVISEIDPEYVEISERNLKNFQLDIEGNLIYVRKSVKNGNKKVSNGEVPKKRVETSYLSLCKKHDRVLTEEEVKNIDSNVYDLLGKYTGSLQKLKNLCKRQFEAEELLK